MVGVVAYLKRSGTDASLTLGTAGASRTGPPAGVPVPNCPPAPSQPAISSNRRKVVSRLSNTTHRIAASSGLIVII